MIQNKKIQENRERRKTSFPKETVENADVHKAALSKEMTIYDCEILFVCWPIFLADSKILFWYDFVPPLNHYA